MLKLTKDQIKKLFEEKKLVICHDYVPGTLSLACPTPGQLNRAPSITRKHHRSLGWNPAFPSEEEWDARNAATEEFLKGWGEILAKGFSTEEDKG